MVFNSLSPSSLVLGKIILYKKSSLWHTMIKLSTLGSLHDYILFIM